MSVLYERSLQSTLEADKIRRGQVDVPKREKLEMFDDQ